MPLSDIRVLDLSHLLPGPLLTLMLADLGAKVTKVERPDVGDLNRRIPPFHHGMSAYYMMLNRNKKKLILNLKSKKDKKIFLQLVQKSDILVENFRPGVMKRLGFDFKTLRKINPRIICCSITGYGQKSSLRDFAGHDLNYAALTGILEATAYPGKKPAMLPTQIADIVGGSLMPMISVLAALRLREKTGQGMYLDCAMTPATMVLLMMVMGKFLITGQEPYQENDRMTGRYPNYNLYQTKDNRSMAVAAIEPKFWNRFCELIQKPQFQSWVPLTDEPGFPTKTLAQKSDRELQLMKKKIQNVFLLKTQKAWTEVFKNEPNACCTPVQNFKESIDFFKKMGRKELMTVKDKAGRSFPQWLFSFGNPLLSRRKHNPPL